MNKNNLSEKELYKEARQKFYLIFKLINLCYT